MKREEIVEKLKSVFPIHHEIKSPVDGQGIITFKKSHDKTSISMDERNFSLYKNGEIVAYDLPLKQISRLDYMDGAVYITMDNGGVIKAEGTTELNGINNIAYDIYFPVGTMVTFKGEMAVVKKAKEVNTPKGICKYCALFGSCECINFACNPIERSDNYHTYVKLI